MARSKTTPASRPGVPGRRPTIGLLIDWLVSEYHTSLWSGVEDLAREREANLICFLGGGLRSPSAFNAQRNVLYDLVSAENVDGLVITSASIGNYIGRQEFAAFCNRYRPLPIVSIGLALEDAWSILADNAQGMRDLLTHLIRDHGYRRIAFIRGASSNAEAERRYHVYTEVLAEYGLPLDPDLVLAGEFRRSIAREAMFRLLDQRRDGLEAVVAASDQMALGVLEALQARGLRVPADVAVAGYDDTKDARFATPPLTTVRQPLYQQGRRAAEMLLSILEGKTVPRQLIQPTELAIRHSCGCSPRSITPLVPDPMTTPGESLETAFAAQREQLLAEMSQTVNYFLRGDELLDAFVAELTGQAPGVFLRLWDQVLRQSAAQGGDVVQWQEALWVLSQHALPYLPDPPAMLRAGSLWQQAQQLSGEVQQAQAYCNLQAERQTPILLNEASHVLVTAADMEQLLEAISGQLLRLGIRGCYLSTYENPARPAEQARLVVASDENGRLQREPNSVLFPARQLAPPGILPKARRYTLMAVSLYFGQDHFGFALLEKGPPEGIIYEVLSVQISTALKGVLLVQQVRDYAVTLEAEVAERTKELRQANEQLQWEVVERMRAKEEIARQAQALAEAQRRLAEVREAEQLRLAQELHDVTIQELLGISYQIEDLRRKAGEKKKAPPAWAQELHGLRQHVLEVSKQLRSLISELRPPGLKELGLVQALEGYVVHLKAEAGRQRLPTMVLELPSALPLLTETAATCLFRVAQEALRNALKHAAAERIEISLRCLKDTIVLRVQDDGLGFQPPAQLSDLTRENHFGLVGMSERVARSGGQLTLTSQAGVGTEVRVSLPLTSQPEEVFDPPRTETIRILLADDHPLVRAGLRATLNAEADFVLAGEAGDGYEAQRLCQELKPDVLLLDLSMPGPSPLETVTLLAKTCPKVKVLILTAFDNEVYARSVVTAGAVGYVLKDEAPEALVRAIRTVQAGDLWLSRPMVEKLVQTKEIPNPLEACNLSPRELEILEMVGRGWDNAQIEVELSLAKQTVRNYMNRIYFKLGVNSRVEAIVWARENLGSPPPAKKDSSKRRPRPPQR